MTTDIWGVLVAAALLLGAAVGAWIALRVARPRFESRLQQATEELRRKHSALAEQLRAAKARADAEQEQARSEFKRQLASVADEPRAAAARAEERLRAAYAEIDRLRRDGGPSDTAPSELGDGFAATRPMRDGM